MQIRTRHNAAFSPKASQEPFSVAYEFRSIWQNKNVGYSGHAKKWEHFRHNRPTRKYWLMTAQTLPENFSQSGPSGIPVLKTQNYPRQRKNSRSVKCLILHALTQVTQQALKLATFIWIRYNDIGPNQFAEVYNVHATWSLKTWNLPQCHHQLSIRPTCWDWPAAINHRCDVIADPLSKTRCDWLRCVSVAISMCTKYFRNMRPGRLSGRGVRLLTRFGSAIAKVRYRKSPLSQRSRVRVRVRVRVG